MQGLVSGHLIVYKCIKTPFITLEVRPGPNPLRSIHDWRSALNFPRFFVDSITSIYDKITLQNVYGLITFYLVRFVVLKFKVLFIHRGTDRVSFDHLPLPQNLVVSNVLIPFGGRKVPEGVTNPPRSCIRRS